MVKHKKSAKVANRQILFLSLLLVSVMSLFFFVVNLSNRQTTTSEAATGYYGRNVTYGDCYRDRRLDSKDTTAISKEIFDGDGTNPSEAYKGTYRGTYRCDANEDGKIDAGDISCIALLIKNGPGACKTTVASIYGDCNADGIINSKDIGAVQQEIFDGDGTTPSGASGGSYKGTMYCDANRDGQINAGDLSCTVLLSQGSKCQ